MNVLVLLLFYLLLPFLVNFLCFKSPLLNKLGPVLIAYAIGLLMGNVGIFPEPSRVMMELINDNEIVLDGDIVDRYYSEGRLTQEDVQYFEIHRLQDILTSLAIALALPMLLFSLNIRAWFKVAGTTFLSLILGLVSVIVPIFTGFFLFRGFVDEPWKVAGMMTGVYSGGTPNLAAMQKALDVDTLTYVVTHTYDIAIGAVFLIFVMSVGQRVLLYFLPAYRKTGIVDENMLTQAGISGKKDFFYPVKKQFLLPNLAALGVAMLILGISLGLGELVQRQNQMVVIILSITTLGILASLIKRIHRIKKTFDYGMYFILVFSIVVASMADLRLFSTSHIHIFYWVILVYIGSLAIHVALAAIFRIDADNVIIVSSALTCSPPFVPVVASALKNKEIVVSGLTVGIVGYAIGNYLGILIAGILSNF